ncbi:hypothetical protein C1H46_026410 [Malus baccata]|uniref:Uncharacterized protein n=1 Tax=Malus baccata TaxID=106549 RepID=A0A540LNI1_MALBA|nr:hypothetical protein C1H46_026410 [Malus baccata]
MRTFTVECGVIRLNTHLCSSINVEHMLSRVLMGKMFGQPLDDHLIKWKLGLLWKNEEGGSRFKEPDGQSITRLRPSSRSGNSFLVGNPNHLD